MMEYEKFQRYFNVIYLISPLITLIGFFIPAYVISGSLMGTKYLIISMVFNVGISIISGGSSLLEVYFSTEIIPILTGIIVVIIAVAFIIFEVLSRRRGLDERLRPLVFVLLSAFIITIAIVDIILGLINTLKLYWALRPIFIPIADIVFLVSGIVVIIPAAFELRRTIQENERNKALLKLKH